MRRDKMGASTDHELPRPQQRPSNLEMLAFFAFIASWVILWAFFVWWRLP